MTGLSFSGKWPTPSPSDCMYQSCCVTFPWGWDTMGLEHNRPDTQWDWNTIGWILQHTVRLEHNWSDTQWDWNTTGLTHNGTGTQSV